jgi:hypothetical protein
VKHFPSNLTEKSFFLPCLTCKYIHVKFLSINCDLKGNISYHNCPYMKGNTSFCSWPTRKKFLLKFTVTWKEIILLSHDMLGNTYSWPNVYNFPFDLKGNISFHSWHLEIIAFELPSDLKGNVPLSHDQMWTILSVTWKEIFPFTNTLQVIFSSKIPSDLKGNISVLPWPASRNAYM